MFEDTFTLHLALDVCPSLFSSKELTMGRFLGRAKFYFST